MSKEIKRGPGRPRHEWDAEKARQIRAMVGLGLTHQKIAVVIGIDPHVMERVYRRELDEGAAQMEARLTQTAYQMAIEDKNPALIMFLLKTKYGYRETNRAEVVVTPGPKSLKDMTDAELAEALARIDKGDK